MKPPVSLGAGRKGEKSVSAGVLPNDTVQARLVHSWRVGRTKVTDLIHRAFLHVVELFGRGAAAEDGKGSFVGSAADAAVDVGFCVER